MEGEGSQDAVNQKKSESQGTFCIERPYGGSTGIDEGNDEGWIIHSNRRKKKNPVYQQQRRKENGETSKHVDWRRSLPSVYVGNIPIRTTKYDLGRLFQGFGPIADIFIASNHNPRRRINFTFGFVRFWHQQIIDDVIMKGNELKLYGHILTIKRSFSRRSVGTIRKAHIGQHRGEAAKSVIQRRTTSYAQALINEPGSNTDNPKVQGSGENSKERMGKETSVESTKNNWAIRSLVGDLRDVEDCSEIQEAMLNKGINCKVRPMGGLKTLLTFQDRNSLVFCVQHKEEFLEEWFEAWSECPEDLTCRDRFAWVEIRFIPLCAWNTCFFQNGRKHHREICGIR